MNFLNDFYNITFIKVIKFYIYCRELPIYKKMHQNKFFNSAKHLRVDDRNYFKE